jgi:hypothetical protein
MMEKERYVLINKCGKMGESGDLVYLASVIGVSDDTLRSRLPYWEDADWILCRFVTVKSRRGGKNPQPFIKKGEY